MKTLIPRYAQTAAGAFSGFLWCCTGLLSCGEAADQTISVTAHVSDSARIFTVENPGPMGISIQMTVNGQLTMEVQSLASAIAAMPDDIPQEPLERKAWRFVMRHMANLNPAGQGRPHDPLVMLWSVGFGQCDDLASVLAHVWEAQGHMVRIWGLEGHVVPEVLVDGRWQMYDPSLGVYYLNRDSAVAGVEELAADPDLITAPVHRFPRRPGQFLIHHVRAYSRQVADIYASASDNLLEPRPEHVRSSMSLHLPAGCRVEMPVGMPDTLSFRGLYGNRWQPQDFVRYTLPDGWTGSIRIPFLPVMVSGNGLAVLGRDTFAIGTPALRERLTAFDRPQDSIILLSTVGRPEIYCLLNSSIFVTGSEDVLSLGGKNAYKLRLSVTTGPARSQGIGAHLADLDITQLAETFLLAYPAGSETADPEERYRQAILVMYEQAGMPSAEGRKAAMAYDSLMQHMGPQGQAYMFSLFEDSAYLALTAALLCRISVKGIAREAARQVQITTRREHP